MATTNFENANLKLLIQDTSGIVTTASLTQKDATPSGGGGTPGGSDTQVQFNNAGAFGGSNQLTWSGAGLSVGVVGIETDGALTGLTTFSAVTIDVSTNMTLRSGAVPALSYQNNNQLVVGDMSHTYIELGGGVSDTSFRSVDGSSFYFNTANGYEFDGSSVSFDFPAKFYDVLKLQPMSEPSSPTEGMIYAGLDHHLYYYNGTTWKTLDN